MTRKRRTVAEERASLLSDAGRWTDEERTHWQAGRCAWQTAYGLPWTEYCQEPVDSATEVYCSAHWAEWVEIESYR
jgi:hypothetical protein